MKHLFYSIFMTTLLMLTSCSSQNMAPSLSFTDIDGKQHSIATNQSQPTLVVFWATDCPGCIQEMPELISLHNEYSDQGLLIYGIAMAHDTPEQIQSMRAKRQLPYILTWDKDASISQAFNNVRVTPTHFLVDPKGEIVMRKIGSLNIASLQQKLHNMGLKPQ